MPLTLSVLPLLIPAGIFISKLSPPSNVIWCLPPSIEVLNGTVIDVFKSKSGAPKPPPKPELPPKPPPKPPEPILMVHR